jgi:hypothetical protein
MHSLAEIQIKPSALQIAAGAAGIASAQFARCKFDVSIQYGRNKAPYDLVVARGGYLLKVSVKGSEDGSWALTDAYLKRAPVHNYKRNDCPDAIDLWFDHHGPRTICCLVQFKGVSLNQLPRIYLATPFEVAQNLREAADRLGTSTLYESYEWSSGTEESLAIETLPATWIFSEERIEQLLTERIPKAPNPTVPHKGPSPLGARPASAEEFLDIKEDVLRSA